MIFKLIKSNFTKDVAGTSLNQIWRFISGPITLILLPLMISSKVQGYWYTFGSVSALSVFADLGFTTIVMQFSAHEFAFLKFSNDNEFLGNSDNIGKISSLFKFVIRWILITSCIIAPIVFFAGFSLFIQKEPAGFWLIPWIIFVLSSIINIINSTISSFFQGCDQVYRIQKILFRTSIIQTFTLYILLISHLGLYALAISSIMTALINFFTILITYRKAIKQMLVCKFKYSWSKEILALLWKYAISWASGYFSSQIFTPIVFQFQGAVTAGKVGLTMSLWNTALSISNIWCTANVPKINMQIELKKEHQVINTLKELYLITSATYFVGLIGIACIVLIGKQLNILIFEKIIARFLPLKAIAFLIIIGANNLLINTMAIYLRAHKEEPYLFPSIASGLLITPMTFIFVRNFNENFVFLGMFIANLLILPWFILVFIRKMKIFKLREQK